MEMIGFHIPAEKQARIMEINLDPDFNSEYFMLVLDEVRAKSYLEEVIVSAARDHHIRTITLDFESGDDEGAEEQGRGLDLYWNHVELLLETIGSLPKLECLRFKYFIGSGFNFPLRLLNRVLAASKATLQCLDLSCCTLDGSEDDVTALSVTVKSMKALSDFRMFTCSLAEAEEGGVVGGGTTTPLVAATSLEAFIDALSKLRTIETINIKGCQLRSLDGADDDSFSYLFTSSDMSPSLRVLRVQGPDFWISQITRNLEINRTLQTLHLGFGNCRSNIMAVVELLRYNSALKELKVWLSSSSSLPSVVNNSTNKEEEEDEFLAMVSALSENTTLLSFTLAGNCGRLLHLPRSTQEAFLNMLKSNYSLYHLELPGMRGHAGEIRREIDFYTELNRLGRKCLIVDFEQTTKEELLDILTKAKHKTALLYYLVRVNPFLLNLAMS